MKKLFLITTLLLVVITTSHTHFISSNLDLITDSLLIPEPSEDELKQERIYYLWEAIKHMESRNGDKNYLIDTLANSVGIAHIRPVMVDEVNRIVNTNRFTYEDRWDDHKSFQIFTIYMNYYNKDYHFEKGCRIWNGGPTGHKKSSTLVYYDKAKLILNSLKNL